MMVKRQTELFHRNDDPEHDKMVAAILENLPDIVQHLYPREPFVEREIRDVVSAL
jgi:hypothetical protein